MKKTLIILSAVLLSVPAFGEDAAAPITKASVSLEDCKRVVKHTPRADVAYKPGVDVHGNPVVGAHGPGEDPSQFPLPDKINIDFGFDLAGKYGISGTGDQTATTDLFKVEYDLGMGGLTVNGKRMNKDDSRAISKACKMMMEKSSGKSSGK